MNHILKKNKIVRNYIFFYNVSPKLKNPFLISLAVHGIIALLSLINAPVKVENQLTIEIINTPVSMAVKNYTKISGVENLSKQNQSKAAKNRLIQADPGSMKNDSKSQSTDNARDGDEGFLKKYENVLFNRKEAAKTVEKSVKKSPEKINWEEESPDFLHSQKDKTGEMHKTAVGKGESSNMIWREGYSRKLVFEPDIDYPEYFRKQGIQGTVRLMIDVDAAGNVVNAEVLHTSGHSKLDILARNGILKAKFLRRENINNNFDRAEVEVQYRLEQ